MPHSIASDLCTGCSGLFVKIFRNITVYVETKGPDQHTCLYVCLGSAISSRETDFEFESRFSGPVNNISWVSGPVNNKSY